MNRRLLIILAFLPLFGFGQLDSETKIFHNGKILFFQSKLVTYEIVDDPIFYYDAERGNYSAGVIDTIFDNSANGWDFINIWPTLRPSYVDAAIPYVYFDGVDKYMEAQDNTVCDIGTGDFSISVKFKPLDVSSNQMLFAKGGSGTDGYNIGISSGGSFRVSIDAAGGTNQAFYPTILSINNEYIFTVNFDRDKKIYFYEDGILSDSAAYASGNDNTLTNTRIPTIGRISTAQAQFFYGNLYVLKVYDRILTQTEITKFYSDNVTILTYNQILDNDEILSNEIIIQ